MKQYVISTKEEYSIKTISIWADKYEEDQWGGLIFLHNDEVVAIFDKKDFTVKE